MKYALHSLALTFVLGCSSTETSSSSSGASGTSGSSGTSGTNSDDAGGGTGDAGSDAGIATNPGARCGYDKGCVAAAANFFCASKPGTKQYQCCKPALPAEAAGCTVASQGTNDDIATYCCTSAP